MTTVETGSRVIVYALGGTIAMSSTLSGGVAPALSAHDLLAAVPGLAESGVTVEVQDFRRVPGASLTLSDISALATAISERLTDVDGAVITQGTDTIEEAAYLLDLLHAGPQPIIVTGAMRAPTLAGADGPANILAAILTAASPHARNQGVLVVFGDEIHAARRVRKTHTTSPATFQSPNGGPLGYLVEGRPRLLNRLTHRTVVPAEPADSIRVAVVPVALGDDGTTVRLLGDHVDGLVLAGFGAGHVPSDLVPALETLCARVPVVLSSRTGGGSVLAATYGFPGSERDLLARGLISAGYLDPYKARILLLTLLATGCDHSTIATAFGAAGGIADPGTWPWPTDFSQGN
ncbi:asparaginase [Nocardia colli]|uniref:Asparaginase n=1 Tax=Nocardia colli TaxID=2545717 RepID=A0A5N0EB98_9NOCA|nr:asparaginase [Nocardia colli]KAA8886223.1 asparaginase [Nocardia colli]